MKVGSQFVAGDLDDAKLYLPWRRAFLPGGGMLLREQP